MKVVIDIDEGRYNWIMSHASNHPNDYANTTDMVFRKAVESGIVLPKGHGALIDKDQFERLLRTYGLDYEADTFIPMATTVIEADKGET